VLYGLSRVKSPVPPIVALLGLLGMVLGEQFGIWIQMKKLDVSRAASAGLVGESYDRPHPLGTLQGGQILERASSDQSI
jgi:XapX domain-containing protein